MKLPKFFVGLLIGGLIGSMYWYYQKSTSAEDGALQLLDRLAASDARVRDLEAALRKKATPQISPEESKKSVNSPGASVQETADVVDNLQQIAGIGPTYARRLKAAGVSSFAGLAAMSPEAVMAITAVRSAAVAGDWIEAARERAAG